MRIIVAFGLAAFLAGEAQAADQFDLVCKGEFKSSALEKTGKPVEHRYRVDLAAKKWCIDDCTLVKPLAEVTPTTLTFQSEKDAATKSSLSHWINRVTGEWRNLYFDPSGPEGTYWDTRGSCEAASFSGINPQTKF